MSEVFLNFLKNLQLKPLHQLTRVIIIIQPMNCWHATSSTFRWLLWAQCDQSSTVIFFLIYLFIYLWLCWVLVSVRGLSLVVASGGHSSSRCTGLSLSRPLSLQSTGSRCAGSVIVAHGLSCSAACGIFPDQGPNPCPLHWQADSQPLRHQGSPTVTFWLIHYCITVSFY